MDSDNVDVLLIGAGAMSSTLGCLLKELNPELTITMVERLDSVAEESTNGWNNAGTGHAAYCELNYTPEQQDGSIKADKAYEINQAFETSLQFWSYLVNKEILPEPENFINDTPHVSFVWGEDNVNFLRKRYEKLKQHHMFCDMEFSDDRDEINEWIPLITHNRDPSQPIAATRVKYGTDVNFGSLSWFMIYDLMQRDNFELLLQHTVGDIEKNDDKSWNVEVIDERNYGKRNITANFVFIGAGGGSLPLLQKTDIPEADAYGGFPVSGQWLICETPEVVDQHRAKVYGKADIGAPPMSVPHLDSRILDGRSVLLFGPFAGFTTKFLKKGSVFDVISSMTTENLYPMLSVGMDNMDLTKYLISESMQSFDDRIESLQRYYPNAKKKNWRLANAGKRVQIIKENKEHGGTLEFGTEVVTSSDGTLAALMGASPGASTAVDAMLQVIERCFKDDLASDEWQNKIREMIPAYGQSLIEDAELLKKTRQYTLTTLNLIE